MLTRALGTTPVCATSRGRTAAGRQTRPVNVKHVSWVVVHHDMQKLAITHKFPFVVLRA
jgi:hypothetical protein